MARRNVHREPWQNSIRGSEQVFPSAVVRIRRAIFIEFRQRTANWREHDLERLVQDPVIAQWLARADQGRQAHIVKFAFPKYAAARAAHNPQHALELFVRRKLINN